MQNNTYALFSFNDPLFYTCSVPKGEHSPPTGAVWLREFSQKRDARVIVDQNPGQLVSSKAVRKAVKRASRAAAGRSRVSSKGGQQSGGSQNPVQQQLAMLERSSGAANVASERSIKPK
jgi:hypothetical protein